MGWVIASSVKDGPQAVKARAKPLGWTHLGLHLNPGFSQLGDSRQVVQFFSSFSVLSP